MKSEKSIHILLADDDASDRELFSEALKSTNLKSTLDEAASAKELFKFLKEGSRPNVIFLDLNMPVKDGRETLRELKADANFMSIPVFIFSTSNAHFDVNESYRSGASLYLSKPNDFNELVEMLRYLLTFSKYVSFP